jgi:hypothetical protein
MVMIRNLVVKFKILHDLFMVLVSVHMEHVMGNWSFRDGFCFDRNISNLEFLVFALNLVFGFFPAGEKSFILISVNLEDFLGILTKFLEF